MSRLISDEVLAIVTIWQEARGETHEGKVAVGEVIRNRMKERQRNVAEIVLSPLQFSGWNTHDPNRIPSALLDDADSVVVECVRAWAESASSTLTDGATLYFNPTLVQPGWAARAHFTAAIGAHRFYRDTL